LQKSHWKHSSWNDNMCFFSLCLVHLLCLSSLASSCQEALFRVAKKDIICCTSPCHGPATTRDPKCDIKFKFLHVSYIL
jgi:hypothetical protein